MDSIKRYTNIGRRLTANMLVFIGSILLVLNFTLTLSVRDYYYTQVGDDISRYAQSFDRLSVADSSQYVSEARTLAEDFPMKAEIELQFLDKNGNVIVSSNGFLPEKEENYGDYESAVKNGLGSWTGKLSSGEKVMSYCSVLTDYGRGSNGAVRCITSLSRIDLQIIYIEIIVLIVSIAIMVVAFLVGKYFVQSIVNPLKDVTNIARQIAAGDFKSRIEVRELNEIGELCDSINYMAGELESTDRLKNEFISSVSHELRTPLTAIKGWGETVRGSVYTDHALVTKGIDVILRESERLSGLVEELLDFSRMQSGRMVYKTEKVDVLAELGEAVCMYEEAAKKAGVMLAYHEPDATACVIGDSNRLTQVFVNVIDNAIKYNHEGGVVQINVAIDNSCVNITVSDTGVGIPAEDLSRVKEKFYKANQTVRGSGIGLAVADEIVRYHNGLLIVDSTEGIGTAVTVALPLALEESAEIGTVGESKADDVLSGQTEDETNK